VSADAPFFLLIPAGAISVSSRQEKAILIPRSIPQVVHRGLSLGMFLTIPGKAVSPGELNRFPQWIKLIVLP
jgi:hypothetical protein